MKNKTIRRVTICAAIAVITVLLLILITRLVQPKYMVGVVEGAMTAEYYRDGTQHDVLFVGDCELYENVSTVKLWRGYGITSYIRGNAQQLIWHSYYLLKDALRYEKPKVVVFNVLSLKYNEPQKETYNRMALDGMKWSRDKVDAINASMTEDEDFVTYVFPLLRYHSRVTSLEKQDFDFLFRTDDVSFAGYYMRADVLPEEGFPAPMPLTDPKLGGNAMKYLGMMAELCEENGIELLLVKAPTESPHWYEEWDRQVADFAAERGINYINFVPLQSEIGLDMSEDTYDKGLHLNVYGAEKFADCLGAYLRDTYALEDHRGDAVLAAHWEEIGNRYDAELAKQLGELEQYGKLVSVGANAIE